VSPNSADLLFAFSLADLADASTLRWWSPDGVASTSKVDGSPVTRADIETEQVLLDVVLVAQQGDGFLGEEVGAYPSRTGRRWIVDGIDGTSGYAAGLTTWGTMIALEQADEIVLGVISSPAQNRRWWAQRGSGAFVGACHGQSMGQSIHVSNTQHVTSQRILTLPAFEKLETTSQLSVQRALGTAPKASGWQWSQQMRVAEGLIDACIWFCGGTWDHAAPSVIVEEAGGRFSDLNGGRQLDSRRALYSNGILHEGLLNGLSA